MPSRKQRRRREKTFRHEYDLVTYDEEGNEVSVDRSELRPVKEKQEKPKQAARGGRSLREPPVPSWRRSLRRGTLWGGVMFVVVVFFFKGQSLPARLAIGLLYAAAFVPLTYWIDRLAYRNYERRSGKK
jgi:cytochrome c-type biogenesis protein CcmH/NrfG